MAHPLSVAHLHTRYRDPGGEDGVVARERRDLRARGLVVVDLDFNNAPARGRAALDMLQAPWNLTSRALVSEAIREHDPDVLHVHNTWFTASPSTFARREIPVVQTIHNYRFTCLNAYLFRDGATCTECIGGSFSSGLRHRCYRGSLTSSVALAATTSVHRSRRTAERSVERTIVLSDFAADLLHRSTGYPRERIVRIDNAVDDPGNRTGPSSESDLVIAVGRITIEKGFGQLIEAWGRLAPENLRLEIIGEGPESARLATDLPPGVSLAGRQTPAEIQEKMLASRALIVPSQWFEGQPLVILEALAAGLPVVATPQPPIMEVLDRAGQVTSTDVGPEALALAMEVLFDDIELTAMSARARQSFLLSHTAAVVGDRLEELYRKVTSD